MSTKFTPTEYSGAQFQQFSLRDILMILFRRRWVILGISLPIIAFGIYGTLTTSDSYVAESQVVIDARTVEDPSFRQLPVEYDILMSTASLTAQSIPVAELATELIFDEVQALVGADGQPLPINTREGLRDKILEKISCGQVGESNILRISFSHENPDLAMAIVKGMTAAFMDYWVESKRNSSAVEYYAEQIALVQAETDALMEKRAKIYIAEGIRAIPANNSAGIQQMRQMEYSYFQARSHRMEMQNQVNDIRRRIRENPNEMPTLIHGTSNDGLVSSYEAWKEARIDLSKLRMTYQDSSVNIVRQTSFVEDTRKMFVESRNNFVNDLAVELSLAAARENSLYSALGEYKADLAAFPALEKRISSLDLQINIQRDLLEALSLKRGEVRLRADSDQRISNITQLNAPSVYLGVSGGKKIIYLLMTIVLAIVLGLVAALLIDAQDHRIFDRRQAESRLELPVLGAISTVGSPTGRR